MNPSENLQVSIDYYTSEICTLLSTITDVKTYNTLFGVFFRMSQVCLTLEAQAKARRSADEHIPLSGKPSVIAGGCRPKKRTRKPKLKLISCGGG